MAHSNVIIQNYCSEHLPGILRLYNYTLAGSAHFLRDHDFLKYVMQHPYINENSIFIAITNNEITGLAILSISNESTKIGTIVEFQAKDSLSMIALVQRSEQYCIDNDVDRLIVVPSPSLSKCSFLKEWNRIQTGTGIMIAKAVSFISVVDSILYKKELQKSFSGKVIALHIGDEIINIKVTSDGVRVNEKGLVSEKNVIRIILPPKLFVKILFCKVNIFFALLTGKIRVNGILKIAPSLKLLNMLKLTDSVYVSIADRI